MKEPSKVPTQLNDKHLSVLYFQDYVKIEENLIKRTKNQQIMRTAYKMHMNNANTFQPVMVPRY